MARARKINDENREGIRADLDSMTRGQVCEKWGVSYQQLQVEFGFTHKKKSKAAIQEPAGAPESQCSGA